MVLDTLSVHMDERMRKEILLRSLFSDWVENVADQNAIKETNLEEMSNSF